MAAIAESVERHHRMIIAVLSLVILAMVVSCTFNGLVPICHWLFGCDHQAHAAVALGAAAVV